MKSGQLHEVLENFDKAIELRPDYALTYSNRGIALGQMHATQAALESYDQAINISPGYAEAYFNRGILLEKSGNPSQLLRTTNMRSRLHRILPMRATTQVICYSN